VSVRQVSGGDTNVRRVSTAVICVALGGLVTCPTRVCAATIQQENFINSVYEQLLERPADPNGLAIFSNVLDSGGTDFDVAYDIDTSPEYYTDLVGSYYESYLSRPPDSQVSAFVADLVGGATDQQVQAILLGSPEFFHDAGGTNADFVNSLYQILLNRSPNPQELDNDVSLLISDTLTQTELATLILDSSEYDTGLIGAWYERFLARPLDPQGQTMFVSQLEDDVTDETVIATILGSPEYFADVENGPATPSAPEPGTFLPLALGLGLVTMKARWSAINR
jgi:hypothetical protein